MTVEDLPVSESLGIFFGITGIDWLAEGYAEPLKAVVVALIYGSLMFGLRRYRAQARKP